MDKNVKNALAAIGAVSLVAAVPVLAGGIAIGVAVADPDKAKKIAKEGLDKVKTFAEEVKAKATEKEPETIEDLFSEDEEVPFHEEEFFTEEVPEEEPEAKPSEEEIRAKREKFIDMLMAIYLEKDA